MVKPGRKYCTFPLTTENRIMLLEIRTLLSGCDSGIELAEIINSALKGYLPSIISTLKRIRSDRELGLLYDSLRAVEAEYKVAEYQVHEAP